MARAYSSSAFSQASPSAAGQWESLRGELVALLDHVEGQYARSVAEEPGYGALSQRMAALRQQVAEPAPVQRHQDALRSVKRAVDRFNERDEGGRINPQDVLQSAIHEIRARQGEPLPPLTPASRQAAPAPAAPVAAPLGELAEAVGGIANRLERLEGELKAQRQSNGSVKDIAEQVSQLTHVVELLAGAVGETGQVKRLESQIAHLAALVSEPRRPDVTEVTGRLDELAATVERLADIQIQHFGRDSRDGPERTQVFSDGMRAIEQSVRNVYNRIDALERNTALSTDDFEKLTEQMARFTEAMRRNEGKPSSLLSLVDQLNARMGQLESRDADVDGLKDDIGALRTSVVEAMEPRFAAIERQLSTLGGKISARPQADPSIAEIESHIRHLAQRMDETHAQLDGLARLYNQDEAQPDFEGLAKLVADRTSEAMVRRMPAQPTGPIRASLDEAGMAEIERRVLRLFDATSREGLDRPSLDLAEMQDGIRRVDERLDRLETSLGQFGRDAAQAARTAAEWREAELPPDPHALADLVARRTSEAMAQRPQAPAPDFQALAELVAKRTGEAVALSMPAPAAPDFERLANLVASRTSEAVARTLPAAPPASPPMPAPAAQAAAPAPAMNTPRAPVAEPAPAGIRIPGPAAGGDSMPKSPSEDFALTDTPFAEPAARQPDMPTIRIPGDPPVAAAPARAEGPPVFNPALVERPPRPESPFAPGKPESFAEEADEPAPEAKRPEPAAAEQLNPQSISTFIAAQRRAAQRQTPAETPTSNSLLGKAFARLQTASKPASRPEQPEAVEPVAEAPVAPAKEKPVKEKLAKAKKAEKPQPTPKAPRTIGLDGVTAGEFAPKPAPVGFLTRYRRPLLLAAVLVGVSLLTLNLVAQRLGGGQAPAADNAAVTDMATDSPEAEVPPAAPVSDAAKVSSLLSIPDVDIDDTVVGSINPDDALAFTGHEQTALSAPDLTAATLTANDLQPAEIASPVKVDLPPEEVGPLDLREAAANGDARAQFEVAAIYTEGKAVKQDLAMAATWYERAAAQGFAPAQYRLASLYEGGKGVAQDLEQARLWYQRAAEAGNRMSMHNLAALYAGGQLGEQQFSPAAEWFEQAAQRGLGDSQFNLGMLYARGLGVDQDFAKSYKWFALAALNGDTEAAKARDDVAKNLDAATLSAIKDEVAKWKAEPIDLVANFAPIGTWSADFDPGQVLSDKDLVKKVQVVLQRLGYDVGTPDGLAGPKTSVAIKAFEHATGMSEIGQINPRLLAVLGSQPV